MGQRELQTAVQPERGLASPRAQSDAKRSSADESYTGQKRYHHWAWSLAWSFPGDAQSYQLTALLLSDSLLKGDLSSMILSLPQTPREAVSRSHIWQQITMSAHEHCQNLGYIGTLWRGASKLTNVKSSTCSHFINYCKLERGTPRSIYYLAFLNSNLLATCGVFSAQETKIIVNNLEYQQHFGFFVKDRFGSENVYILPKEWTMTSYLCCLSLSYKWSLMLLTMRHHCPGDMTWSLYLKTLRNLLKFKDFQKSNLGELGNPDSTIGKGTKFSNHS